ncbi:hypothetical protein [Dyadobacter sp. Leaf189]|uniref:hypothetical protein n=1 Tax=Dyadobacter sp. Leaf189 TaxID=1736295 RepID=UPI0006F507C2|nr:hypothetical protein [Dyadobacter sp. Leaf189]KQS30794.1 hypothetical protein ASG33_10460 [Dyadobacter sp. Leaf189]
MIILIWICIVADVAAAVFLLVTSMTSNQDAAGAGMVLLPAILLIGLALLSYFLMQKQHNGWAFVTSGFPALILLYLLFISVT